MWIFFWEKLCEEIILFLYYLPGPLHVETIAESPIITIFHDFLSDEEMRSMKLSITAQMEVSTVQDIKKADGGGIKISTERTQSSGWLWDEDYPGLYKMSRRLGRATKLVTFRQRALGEHELQHFVEAEAWQVGVYSPGGHYLPHFDDFDILDPQSYSPDGESDY